MELSSSEKRPSEGGPDAREVWRWLKDVPDPEIPVLNIVEMGIVRGVEVAGGRIVVRITPTYSGCPAMNAIEQDIRSMLIRMNMAEVDVVTDWKEAWTTDWFSDKTRAKLKAYGIAPPPRRLDDGIREDETSGDQTSGDGISRPGISRPGISGAAFKIMLKIVPCPLCDALETRLVSEFGSTACKSQYMCDACRNPFEHFKCI